MLAETIRMEDKTKELLLDLKYFKVLIKKKLKELKWKKWKFKKL